MISFKTCIELAYVIDKYGTDTINRIFYVFGIDGLIHSSLGRKSNAEKTNMLLMKLKHSSSAGPFTESFQMDMLQYMVDHFYRYQNKPLDADKYIQKHDMFVKYEDLFSYENQPLCNSLKRDGYVIKEKIIKKLLPEEILEAKTESELFSLLDKFQFATTKGHLEQARINHSQSNWAGANSQFRPFIESLLIDICKIILPTNPCQTGASAIKLLSKTANPPFLESDLNEVENQNCKTPFIDGLWKRLHPQGTHPGLSSNEDSTFRYHISIVFAHYLLKRLEARA